MRKRACEEGRRVPMSSSSRRRVQPPPPPPPPPELRPAIEEAIRYVAAAEREFIEFAGKPGKVEEFHAVLDEYRLGRLSVAGVADRMELVLLGHPYLIRGINKFMPRGYVVRDLYCH
ncbi:hypothetical protein SETIT_6G019400v2 [Setaria italica]|nr:hypothetical protein SETIT_6G019400v2 [Setaria italica]TKW08258.1 hypothetical protein SEVIR_6G017700v2 [Setaria viridis]